MAPTEKQENKETQDKKYLYGLGRRKTAIARAKIYSDSKGDIIVNGKNYQEYFKFFSLSQNLTQPFEVIGKQNEYSTELKIIGGGPNAQSEAARLAIARALLREDEAYKPVLKKAGYLSRDPRAKERKKYGHKRARRSPQWSKR